MPNQLFLNVHTNQIQASSSLKGKFQYQFSLSVSTVLDLLEPRQSPGLIACLTTLCLCFCLLTLQAQVIEQVTVEGKQELKTITYEIPGIGDDLSKAQQDEYISKVLEILKNWLYNQGGEQKALANGRKLIGNMEAKSITVIDTQDNHAKVRKFLGAFKGFVKDHPYNPLPDIKEIYNSSIGVKDLTELGSVFDKVDYERFIYHEAPKGMINKFYPIDHQTVAELLELLNQEFDSEIQNDFFLFAIDVKSNTLRLTYREGADLEPIQSIIRKFDLPNDTAIVRVRSLDFSGVSASHVTQAKEQLKGGTFDSQDIEDWIARNLVKIGHDRREFLKAGQASQIEMHTFEEFLIDHPSGGLRPANLWIFLSLKIKFQKSNGNIMKGSGLLTSRFTDKVKETVFPISLSKTEEETGLLAIGYTSASTGETEYLIMTGSFR